MNRLLIALVPALALGIAACSGPSAERDDAGEVTSSETVLSWELETGDCVLLPEGLAGATEPTEVHDLEVVPCAQEHDSEVYEVFELADGDYPGDEAVQEATTTGCYDAFAEFVGVPYEESAYDFVGLFPTELTWSKLASRDVACMVYDLTGAKLTGTLEGVGAAAAPSEPGKPESEESAQPEGVETVPTPLAVETTPPDEPRSVSVWDLGLGDCYTVPADPNAEFFDLVPCTEPHTDEVYLTFDLPEGDYPGDQVISEQADQGCHAEFELFVGIPYQDSTLEYLYFAPDALTWTRMDDREVVCTIVDGQGGELTQSMRGAAR